METSRAKATDATRIAQDIAEAVGLLTRLPIRLRHTPRGAGAAWAYPLAGALAGLVAGGVAWLCAGLPPALTAGFALAAQIIVTGALHEDGLADSADGLWGGWTRSRRLEIMRDSRIGAYGVLALILGVGLRWAALTALASAGALWPVLIGVAALSRAPMAALMWAMPNARADGLSASTGRASAGAASVGTGLALVVGLLCVGGAVFAVAFALAPISLAVALIARAKIGGQTGDILGACQQLCEIAALVVLCAALA